MINDLLPIALLSCPAAANTIVSCIPFIIKNSRKFPFV